MEQIIFLQDKCLSLYCLKDKWKDLELEKMVKGGNANAKSFLGN